MFENFKKITIKGGCFENETDIELFKKYSISLLYGRNGSGKTTIAHSIEELIKPDDEKNSEFSISSESTISEDKKDSVYIFDENFIRQQVKVERDGINTIVMLGEQVEIDQQIGTKEKELQQINMNISILNRDREKYDNPKENISPLFYQNQIKNALRTEGGWADIDRDLKGNTVKSHITEDIIKMLTDQLEPNETYEQLKDSLSADLHLLKESKNAQSILWTKPDIVLPKGLLEINKLLAKPIDAPNLSEREQRILNLFASHQNYSMAATKNLLSEGWSFCPTCLRDITEHDKVSISQTLAHILNEEANKYESLLQATLDSFISIEIDLPLFGGKLNEQELNTAKSAINSLNSILEDIRDVIRKRKNNLYTVIADAFSVEFQESYTDALLRVNSSLDTLVKCITLFNESVNKRTELINKAQKKNNQVSRKQLSHLFTSYKPAIENSIKNQKELEIKKNEYDTIVGEIKKLEAKKERTDIALGYINQELQYVFFSQRKMKLEPGDGCYKLKINGKSVKPQKISIGERNALGLCYFFAKLFGGKTELDKYSSEYLIVLDDPISSFDYGSRIGIMSLLRYQFRNIISGNKNSRILVMSHDLHSIFDLVKIRNEILTPKQNDFSFMELSNNKLAITRVRNEYKKLLELVFSYAVDSSTKDPDDTLEIGIGNIMRRMLEAFSSFCYNESFEQMLRNESILVVIPKEKHDYYENFMYRLTLNTESHMEESIYSLNSVISHFSRTEKIQTAKSVLLFLNYINRPHLQAYLSEEQMNTIEKWKDEEKNWMLPTS